jgi:adenosylcobinamide-phosphate synthase
VQRLTARAAGLLLGHAADRAFGDPRRRHPVAGFGRLATGLEGRLYGDDRGRGVAHVALLVGGSTALATVVDRRLRSWVPSALFTAAVTWAVLGGRSLEREAQAVFDLLAADDLDGARRRLTHLVGRDTTALSPDEVARAVVESVAENSSDAVVTSLFWGSVAGAPGLIAHRTVNTLDAMIGHHNARYERFGWAAARFDDLLGLPGARIGGALVVLAGPDRRGALTAWRRDARRHPSPNAGVVEAAFAGALGIRLGGVNTYYGNRREERALMGDGRSPTPADIPPTIRLARTVGLSAVLTAAGTCLVRAARSRHRRRR